ncbi:MAG: prepilin-type N-terminal cleavage/methylation domain-containing protein [Kiritimatiellales bacterium]|nr:prepilin-type N-terminal cleavage/methylation domain-containing protein [Kiritimatiellota bacterium]MBL7015933.1 prepilin-type N-terminal cleavage/methylation domain-containing protein [Kiritimatiellales bacterium]
MKKQNHKNGLTLIELMVAMVAASIIILIASLILIMAFRSWRVNNAYVNLRRDSAFAFTMMARNVRESDTDEVEWAGGTLTIPSSVLGKPTVSYYRDGEALRYNENGGTMTLIHDNVDEFSATTTGDPEADDGVLLRLVLADADFGIAITNEMFVNTRN